MQQLTMEERENDERQMDEMWAEVAASMEVHNAEAERSNDRIIRIIRHRFGNAFVRHLLTFLHENEADGFMGFDHVWEISRKHGQHECQTNEYGRKLRKYWVDQWPTGTEGDSFAGHFYFELKPNRYLKVPFSC